MYKIPPFSFSYQQSGNGKKIFSENTLEFNRHEAIAIIGPSGSGKSTFLKIMKGIIPEYSGGRLQGKIYFCGELLTGDYIRTFSKNILYLFQNPFSQLIYPHTEEEFLFTMENFNFTKEEMDKEIEKFEKDFGLQNLWGKSTAEISNGECQKLVLASLLAINPDVLLLDEPTAFLDPSARKTFYQILKEIKGQRLLVIVDHHLEEIRPLIDRVIEVDLEGRIVESSFDLFQSKIKREIDDSISRSTLNQALLSPPLAPLKMEVKNLCFAYDRNKELLLKNINVIFKGGEVVCIKGKNGAGKSTFFKLLAGIERPQEGSIRTDIENKNYKNAKIFSQVGFIFQNPETHFFFDTIKEELDQSFKHLDDETAKFKDQLLMKFFRDVDFEKSPFLLSEGEKRRLSILMTVFLNKSLLFYDEPTFGQDLKSIEEIILLMQELKKRGLLQLFISHDEYFISRVADRVFNLENGELYEIL